MNPCDLVSTLRPLSQYCVYCPFGVGQPHAEMRAPAGRVSGLASARGVILSSPALMAFCFVGLQLSYLTWGYVQEKVMTTEYTTGRFPSATFCVFSNRVLAILVALALTDNCALTSFITVWSEQ